MPSKPQRLLHEALPLVAQAHPTKVAVIVGGRAYTYAELAEQSRRLAAALQARGLQRGDRVAIYMDNTWSCVVAIYAVLQAGGVFLVVNPQTKADKLAFVLNDCAVKVLFCDAHLAYVYDKALGDVPSLTHAIVAGGDAVSPAAGAAPPAVEAWTDVLAGAEAVPRDAGTIALDLASLIYTSGSTGNPKGVMHTHQSMLFAAGSLIEYLRMDADEVIVNVLPLAFDYGLYQLLMAVQLGATLVLERSFTYPADVFKRLEQHGVTTFPGVPTIYSIILAAHSRKPLSFPSVKRITNTAAALPSDYVPRLREVFPNALVFKMYGLTECKRVSYLEPELADLKPRSVGKAIPGTEIFLLNAEGRPAAPHEPGILHVRGPHVMVGYWNRPEQSAQMLCAGRLPGERILRTGDWFHTDEEGFLYFDGRSDDIIKTRGEKVSPVEVENVLYGVPGVLEAAVIGVADDLLGQAIRAYVVRVPGAGLQERSLRRELNEKLENFMVPRDIIFVDSLPKSPSGKISKKDLT
ncbi:MAG: AMP-binding protein [Candidatus Krumholzibacteria bacterium]|nr:AMP-binding protein [Candidatus Krumholzibacteria bacterium]